MDNRRGIYIIIILLLIIGISVVLYSRKDKTIKENVSFDEVKNEKVEKIESDTGVDKRYYEEITAKHVDKVEGSKVYDFTKQLNGKNFNIKISFNTKSEVENIDGEEMERQVVLYQIYLNNYLVSNASDIYYFDSGEENENYIPLITDNNIKVIKGEDNKDYLLVSIFTPNFDNENNENNIFIINEFSRLIGVLNIDEFVKMHKLEGEGSDKYITDNDYTYYVVTDDKLYYLVSESEFNNEALKCDYTEHILTINHNKIITNGSVSYVGSEFDDHQSFSSVTLKEF